MPFDPPLTVPEVDAALHDRRTENYRLLPRGLTVEHILPQEWEDNWPLPQKEGENPEEYVERRQRRNHLLHTIGNVTLLTQPLNSTISNAPYERKKAKILEHSAVNLNRFLQDMDHWDEACIWQRGIDLCEVAKVIWPYPAKAED